MTHMRRRHVARAIGLALAIALLAGCAAERADGGLWARLTAANLLAGSMAQGLNSATDAKVIAPGSQRAILIAQTLDAVELSLEGAGTALRAGLPSMAERQIGAAETQLGGLEPLLPSNTGETQ